MKWQQPAFRLQDRWPTAREFLRAVERCWGHPCYHLSADREMACVRCPVCLPPSKDWHDWPFVVAKCGDGWTHIAWCFCPDEAIAAALIRYERDRLDLALADLAA